MQKTILLADDNEDLRMLLSHELKFRGYNVITAENGVQAVEKAVAEKPDLILMDIMMPVKDGTQAAEDLKEIPSACDIPVLFLTSLVQKDEESGSEVADRAALPKSMRADDLVRVIESVLAKKGKQNYSVADDADSAV